MILGMTMILKMIRCIVRLFSLVSGMVISGNSKQWVYEHFSGTSRQLHRIKRFFFDVKRVESQGRVRQI